MPEAGKFAEAEEYYRQLLAITANHLDAFKRMGAMPIRAAF